MMCFNVNARGANKASSYDASITSGDLVSSWKTEDGGRGLTVCKFSGGSLKITESFVWGNFVGYKTMDFIKI